MHGYMAKLAQVKLIRTHHGNIQLLTSSQLGNEGRTESLSVYLPSSGEISFFTKLLLDSCRYGQQPSPDCTSVSSSCLFSVSSFFPCPVLCLTECPKAALKAPLNLVKPQDWQTSSCWLFFGFGFGFVAVVGFWFFCLVCCCCCLFCFFELFRMFVMQ